MNELSSRIQQAYYIALDAGFTETAEALRAIGERETRFEALSVNRKFIDNLVAKVIPTNQFSKTTTDPRSSRRSMARATKKINLS